MREIFRNSIHNSDESHDCLIGAIKGVKIKITYQAYNAVEKCNTEIFDGYKWNNILSMLDMGVQPNNSAYNVWDETRRKERANNLFSKAVKMCNGII